MLGRGRRCPWPLSNGMRLSCGADPVGAPELKTSTEPAGAQTEFFPKPGAVSFKRLLGRRSSQPYLEGDNCFSQ